MEISRIVSQPMGMNTEKQLLDSSKKEKESFGQILSGYLNQANQQLVQSEKLTAQLATGEVRNVHDVTIAAQKASIALQLTVQVRDKAVEAYQEIMRMQL